MVTSQDIDWYQTAFLMSKDPVCLLVIHMHVFSCPSIFRGGVYLLFTGLPVP